MTQSDKLTTLTTNQKHALIATRIEGIHFSTKKFQSTTGPVTGYRMEYADGTAIQEHGGTWGWGWNSEKWEFWPDYSSSLDLCARAEAKIAQMGTRARCLYFTIVDQLCFTGNIDERFYAITAPAPVRVEAMILFIQTVL